MSSSLIPKLFRFSQNAMAVSGPKTSFIIFPGKEQALVECCQALVDLRLPYSILVWDKGNRYSPGGGQRLNYSTEIIVLAWNENEEVIAFANEL